MAGGLAALADEASGISVGELIAFHSQGLDHY
jgi:hypothetical protein